MCEWICFLLYIYIFSFEYNLFNFLLICNVHVYLSHIPFIVCHEFIQNCLNETFMDYATCQWVSRVSTINVCHKRRDRSRGKLFLFIWQCTNMQIILIKLCDLQFIMRAKNGWTCWNPIFVFWQMNKNLLNQLRVFFIFFITYTRVGFVKFSRSINSLVM